MTQSRLNSVANEDHKSPIYMQQPITCCQRRSKLQVQAAETLGPICSGALLLSEYTTWQPIKVHRQRSKQDKAGVLGIPLASNIKTLSSGNLDCIQNLANVPFLSLVQQSGNVFQVNFTRSQIPAVLKRNLKQAFFAGFCIDWLVVFTFP